MQNCQWDQMNTFVSKWFQQFDKGSLYLLSFSVLPKLNQTKHTEVAGQKTNILLFSNEASMYLEQYEECGIKCAGFPSV